MPLLPSTRRYQRKSVWPGTVVVTGHTAVAPLVVEVRPVTTGKRVSADQFAGSVPKLAPVYFSDEGVASQEMPPRWQAWKTGSYGPVPLPVSLMPTSSVCSVVLLAPGLAWAKTSRVVTSQPCAPGMP